MCFRGEGESSSRNLGRRTPEIDAVRRRAALSVSGCHIFWETLEGPVLLAGHFDVIRQPDWLGGVGRCASKRASSLSMTFSAG